MDSQGKGQQKWCQMAIIHHASHAFSIVRLSVLNGLPVALELTGTHSHRIYLEPPYWASSWNHLEQTYCGDAVCRPAFSE